MEVLDAKSLAERLKWEAKEYWLHLEAESPLDKYPAKQHARRVQEKLGVETGLIYLPGQRMSTNQDSDMPAPFRQLRYFYYISGCNESDCHLTYDIQHDTLSLFLPRIDEKRVIWYGRGSTLAEALMKYDVDEVYYSDEVSGYIKDWYRHNSNSGSLYILHPSQSNSIGCFGVNPGDINTTSLQPAMNIARMIKDEHEIKLIQRANDISSKAHREVLANISKFKNEAQVEGLFLDVCVSHQAKQQAYDPIAGSGPNAGTLHYDANNEDFEDRQLMCLDAGCEYELYASDITRTFPLSSKWPSREAKNIYKLVERMQESCIKRLAPGVRYLDLHILAHQIAIDGLLSLGILHNGTKEEIYKAGTSKAFFPHGLGHHVGLEVHDVGQAELMSVRRGKQGFEQPPSLYPVNFHVPVYDPKACHAPVDPLSSHLEEGMVVTVEPGIYFSVYALEHFYLHSPIHSRYINQDVLKHYLPIGGVRIEDDLLITSKGYENLTTAPKGDAMLDIIRRGKSDDTPLATRRLSMRAQANEKTIPRLRAPGISTDNPASILKPLARAATMPTEYQQRKSVDFEPFEGPSLFTNFKRSMTTDERIRHWQHDRDVALASQEQPGTGSSSTVCGNNTKELKHVFLTTGTHRSLNPYTERLEHSLPTCKKCTILCEALDRLRQNLDSTEQRSSKQTDLKDTAVPSKQETIIPQMHALPLRQRSTLPPRQERVHFSHPVQTAPQPSTNPFRHAPSTQQLDESFGHASLRRHRSVPGHMNTRQSSRNIYSGPSQTIPELRHLSSEIRPCALDAGPPRIRPNATLERARTRHVTSEAEARARTLRNPDANRVFLSHEAMRAARLERQFHFLSTAEQVMGDVRVNDEVRGDLQRGAEQRLPTGGEEDGRGRVS
ncbi:peptidase M24, structural domain-containing protein [Phaeosphaeria sp. MPI-PUGE-AT-0046c]|nr:peptidase M24, structural domain-containing protein [Phaeosphaeria sp. MPI-PUGE-AT-0046c]